MEETSQSPSGNEEDFMIMQANDLDLGSMKIAVLPSQDLSVSMGFQQENSQVDQNNTVKKSDAGGQIRIELDSSEDEVSEMQSLASEDKLSDMDIQESIQEDPNSQKPLEGAEAISNYLFNNQNRPKFHVRPEVEESNMLAKRSNIKV